MFVIRVSWYTGIEDFFKPARRSGGIHLVTRPTMNAHLQNSSIPLVVDSKGQRSNVRSLDPASGQIKYSSVILKNPMQVYTSDTHEDKWIDSIGLRNSNTDPKPNRERQQDNKMTTSTI
ncbi:hypothetical protein MPTK1_8g00120 [Marchantia polymorpha subsp. ruderalis]|uniref:Uncharacterized protein n=1 Tax=Marchantia polymorpha TaxID=3197 RepID=A0A2R6WLJ8_MARPO|nr:hypothetical protein MARPO_0077s0056 [Marchantia polymorpha]BBN18146.1 hypothetical protein Mp_8g00120 [Marchantia polymorpha subsp. ruderalis]|eukprot:PTQ34736.1 hypothetical protein MARPO_0077s0056 [Marchantia polymorpha]